MYFCIILYSCWVLNVIMYFIWYYLAKKDMLKRNIEWSGDFDAMSSCLMIYGFLGPVGTILIPCAIFTKTFN